MTRPTSHRNKVRYEPSCKSFKPYVVPELPSKSSRRYAIVDFLGSGSSAEVYRALHKNRCLAIKVLRKELKNHAECDIQPELRHPNIVESYRAFTFEGITHIVLELCAKGSLYNLVKTCGSIAEIEVGRYMIQLAGGIKYIHSKGVMHRDIKLDNIFVDELGDVKIGDFSLAAYIQPNNDGLEACGTLGYMAPEMFKLKDGGPGRYTEQVDLWSLGVTCLFMLAGSPPFYASGCEASCCRALCYKRVHDEEIRNKEIHDNEIRDRIRACGYDWPVKPPSSAAQGLVERLLVGPEIRPTPDDIVEDSLFTSQDHDTQLLYRTYCRLAGVGKNETGHLFPSVGRKEWLHG